MIELEQQDATLLNYNPRTELHGQDPTPAADVRFAFNAASGDVLPMLDPTLRSFLFFKSGTKQHDLASQGHEAPDLRFPKLAKPLAWSVTLEEAELTIHRGLGGISDLVFTLAKVKKPLLIAPQQGGTVVVEIQVQCYPDEKQAGALFTLMGQKISVSFKPGKETAGGGDNGGDDNGGQ